MFSGGQLSITTEDSIAYALSDCCSTNVRKCQCKMFWCVGQARQVRQRSLYKLGFGCSTFCTTNREEEVTLVQGYLFESRDVSFEKAFWNAEKYHVLPRCLDAQLVKALNSEISDLTFISPTNNPHTFVQPCIMRDWALTTCCMLSLQRDEDHNLFPISRSNAKRAVGSAFCMKHFLVDAACMVDKGNIVATVLPTSNLNNSAFQAHMCDQVFVKTQHAQPQII